MNLNTPTPVIAAAVTEAAEVMQSFVLREAADRLTLLSAEVGRLHAELSKFKREIDTSPECVDGAGAFGLVPECEEAA